MVGQEALSVQDASINFAAVGSLQDQSSKTRLDSRSLHDVQGSIDQLRCFRIQHRPFVDVPDAPQSGATPKNLEAAGDVPTRSENHPERLPTFSTLGHTPQARLL